jgi:hypothetical protein
VNLSLRAPLPVLLSIVSIAPFALPASASAGTDKWSQPAILDSCSGVGAPSVVFPQDKPTHATGPGAIVWSASSPCPGGAGARVAAISPEDIPAQPASPRTATGRTIALGYPLAAAGGPYGRIVIAGASLGASVGVSAGASTGIFGGAPVGASASAPAGALTPPAGELLLTEGQASGPFTTPLALGAPASTFAFTTAYLGDVAFVSPTVSSPGRNTRPGSPSRADGQPGGLQLRVQRHHAGRFATPIQVTPAAGAGTGAVDALTAALDFRSDRLVVFSQRGSVYARELPASGAPHPLQRLGPAPPSGARIAAVASDDDRGIVAWSYRHAGQTSIYVARSQSGVRFTGAQLLERFPDPPDLPNYVDSPRIVRLSSESVMLAWTGVESGHWVIRTAPIDLHGVRAANTISPPGRDALLAGFAPGPANEVLALWTEPLQTAGELDLGSQAIFAARGFDAYPGQTSFAAGEQIAPPGPNSDATIALDPSSDRAIAAWRTGAGQLAYSVRAVGGS